ncbi:hypothetical protein ABFS82_05G001300 [Erythranthe guttata]
MTTSRRVAERKVERFEKNITKRGSVPETTTDLIPSWPCLAWLLHFCCHWFISIPDNQDGYKWRRDGLINPTPHIIYSFSLFVHSN